MRKRGKEKKDGVGGRVLEGKGVVVKEGGKFGGGREGVLVEGEGARKEKKDGIRKWEGIKGGSGRGREVWGRGGGCPGGGRGESAIYCW